MNYQFVRIGALAEVHAALGDGSFPRGRRVIVRTERGVELGEVIGPCRDPAAATKTRRHAPVRILRGTTEEDELLLRRLDRHKRQAVEACREALAAEGCLCTLLDVDQLFDGGTLVMHFLGPVDQVATDVTRRIAERYESIVRSRHFARLLSQGCGPGCGTEEGAGCGTGCAGCAVASACSSKAR